MRFYSIYSLMFLFCLLSFVIGCDRGDASEIEVAFVEAIPPSGSTIQPYTPITVKFDGSPLGLYCASCVIEDGTISEEIDLSHSGKLSQSGKITTITGPFKSDSQLKIFLRWGKGGSTDSLVPNESEVILTYTVAPEWTDDVITITAGRFKDRSKLQALFTEEGWVSSNAHFEGFSDKDFTLPVFPMAQETYTIDIAIVSMIEVGIDKPTTIETIREHYLEQGYRPLSLEEMYELRLQFADQPAIPCGEEKTNAFHVLLSRDDIYTVSGDNNTIHDSDRSYFIPILSREYSLNNPRSPIMHISYAPCRLSDQLRFPAPPEPLTGHTGDVRSVSFSPNGRMLASGSWDGNIRLWEVDTGTGKRLAFANGAVNSVSFSPNGRMLASGSRWGDIHLWEVNTGSLIRTFTGHTDQVNSVSFSPNGRMLASGSLDETIRLWDVNTGSLIVWYTMQDAVNSVSFSPDGEMLASGSGDGNIHLGEVNETLQGLGAHAGGVNSVLFSPDGRTLASGSDDHTIRLWNVDTSRHLRVLEGHKRKVNSVSFSPDSEMLASGSGDETIRLWKVDTGSPIRTFTGHTHSVTSLSFSPDGEMLASGSKDETIRLWDPKINYHDVGEVSLFVELYIDKIKSLTNADDNGWVLIPPRSDKYLEYATGYSSCETRFACVITEKKK